MIDLSLKTRVLVPLVLALGAMLGASIFMIHRHSRANIYEGVSQAREVTIEFFAGNA